MTRPDPDPPELTRAFVREMLVRAALGIVAMGCAFLGAWIGRRVGGEWSPLVGALVGLAVGIVVLGAVLARRRDRAG